jgi:ATF/CREB family transcription factor
MANISSSVGHSIAPLASHLAYEPNPFEHSFATGATVETPGGTKLPSVAALTSPAPLLPGGGTTPYNWGGSLRTGPLSPAMLSGPTNDYFGDSHLRGGFPTPNESSLRTGLTPGGGGSMFPAPSPNSQALYNSLASGGATPSTLDFHRTAMNAAAAAKRNDAQLQNITSQPQDILNGMDGKALQNQPGNEVFGQHDANDAANGLFMLASQSRTNSQGGQYAMAQQQTVHAHPQPSNNMMGVQSTDTSPIIAARNHSGSLSTASGRGVSEISEESEQKNRPNTRGRGKKGATAQTNGRRKTEDTPSKGPASKKSKGNSGNANSMMEPEPPSEEEPDLSKDEYNANGKKMTDEEKRKNFLERNR